MNTIAMDKKMDYSFLAEGIEHLMFKKGEYDRPANDRILWLKGEIEPYTLSNREEFEQARDNVKNNIMSCLKTASGRNQLYDYLRREISDIQINDDATANDIDIMNKAIRIVNILKMDFREYGSDKERDKLVDAKDVIQPRAAKLTAARQGYGVDVLVDDEDPVVRIEVARTGYSLEQLSVDPVASVRAEVALNGYALEHLINDKSTIVRMAVADMDFGLDRLINDENENVRSQVAKRGYRLNTLENDESSFVRAEVAKQGYDLDNLINDESSMVRVAVAQQGHSEHLDILRNDSDILVRVAVAEQGRLEDLSLLINDENENVKEAARYTMCDKADNILRNMYNRCINNTGADVSYHEFKTKIGISNDGIEKWAENDEKPIIIEYSNNIDKYNGLMTNNLHSILENNDPEIKNKGEDALFRLLDKTYNNAEPLEAGQDISQKLDEYTTVRVTRDPMFNRNTSENNSFSLDVFKNSDSSRIAYTSYFPASKLNEMLYNVWYSKGDTDMLKRTPYVTLDNVALKQKQINQNERG